MPRGDVHPAIVTEICQVVNDQMVALLHVHQTQLASQISSIMERALSDVAVGLPAPSEGCDHETDGEQVEEALDKDLRDASLTRSESTPRSSPNRDSELRMVNVRSTWFSLDAEDHARKQLAKSYTPSSFPKEQKNMWERCVQACISSCAFEMLIAIAIASNSVLIGLEVEMLSRNPDRSLPGWFYVIIHAYTVLFCVELMARLAVNRLTFCRSEDWAWNCFDVAVVVSSLVELCIDAIGLSSAASNEHVQNVSNIRIVRVLRIARLLRVVRIARLVSFITALRLLVSSMLATLRSLIWAFVLMLIIIYIFAIVFAQSAYEALEACDDGGALAAGCSGGSLARYWGTLGTSMFTLYMSVTGGLSWEAAAEPLGEVSWLLVGLFILFIFIMYFAVLNVVTGFFCQAASDAARHDPEVVVQTVISTRRKYEAQIKNLFKSLDIHGSGQITYYELCEAIKDARVQAQFEGLLVDVSNPWTLFKLINLSKSNSVDIDEFIMGCMRLKGAAKSVDVEKLQSDNRWFMKKVTKFMHNVDIQLALIAHNKHCKAVTTEPSIDDLSQQVEELAL